MKRAAIIMAGGAGERFWPLSRQTYPKQLLKFTGNRSMLGASIERIGPLVAPEDVYIVTNRALKPAIEADATELPADNVIAEPQGRNTAACLALASAILSHRYRDEEDVIMVVLTADHCIRDTPQFAADFRQAIEFAEKNDSLLTFGIVPDRPETGYGYIELGKKHDAEPKVTRVVSFREKPDLDTALSFQQSGRFLWNSGMFVWRNSVIREAFRRHLPEVHAQIVPMCEACAGAEPEAGLAAAFNKMPKISIDYGVMERADNVHVVKAEFDWDDIGTWSSLHRLLDVDAGGNVVFGNSLALGCENSVIYSTGACDEKELPVVVGFNLKDTIVVRTRDAIIVLPAESAQQVKEVVSHLREKGQTQYL